jgi:3-oxoacyl-[acyl-carrier-protein] synthase-3
VSKKAFKTKLFLPAQAAAETEATIVKWTIGEHESFTKGQSLAEIESAKSTFEFDAPCSGVVTRILHPEEATIPFDEPVLEIETDDEEYVTTIPAAAAKEETESPTAPQSAAPPSPAPRSSAIRLLGIGGYLPQRVVSNKDIVEQLEDLSDDYIYSVSGIRTRCWASETERPSDMAVAAARDAMSKSAMKPEDIGALILATTTPDAAMPATACSVEKMLNLRSIPAFDISAACSGWLYGIGIAEGFIRTGIADNILVIGVDMQSRLIDKNDKDAYVLFGDGAGATIVSGSRNEGHRIVATQLSTDSRGLRLARRDFPGYTVPSEASEADPWIRLNGRALFRSAMEHFVFVIEKSLSLSNWRTDNVRWVVPHQANSRILKAAAKKCGIPFERFYMNIEHVGNTSSASIPLALVEMEKMLQRNDNLILCSVGAGITGASISVEW